MIETVDANGNVVSTKKVYTQEQMAAKGLTEDDLNLNINNLSVSTVTTMIMMSGCAEEKRENAWRFRQYSLHDKRNSRKGRILKYG
jgi:hypothetical protein